MPPWPEWQIEYIGTRFLGKLLGLWSVFLISLCKRLLRCFATSTKSLERSVRRNSSHSGLGKNDRPSKFTAVKKLYKLVVATVLMLGIWRIATLKPIWSATDERGHRVIVAFLFLVTACWLVSSIWICFSSSQARTIEVGPRNKHAARPLHLS